ncbi:YceI family protein [soil metagenome]
MTTVTRNDTVQLTGEYTIDPSHSRFGFVTRHAMVAKVRGQFADFSGSLRIDGDDPINSSGQLSMQAASIDTRNEDRDAHLRSNDFLAMDGFPEITFQTTGITSKGDDVFTVTGDLTLRGVTKPVTFETTYAGTAVDPFNNTRVGFEGSTVINRKDWGVSWNAPLEAGGVLVSEKVTLEFEISAIQNG